ncbi:hypothetical protein FO519_004097 [Halicephalobus sp. NKZ332]|nr:hypothetical protein FO519_004097 [Halicephalobus sp. NKZ332]
MKRKRVLDEPDQPGAKKRHYEDRMANRLNSLDLCSESQLQEQQHSSDDELYIREIDPEDLDGSPLNFDTDEDSQQPIIEEPDEDEDPESFVLSDELRRIMDAAKKERILPNLIPKSTGRELVIWRPPTSPVNNFPESSEENSINNRIHEVPEDIEFADLSNEPTSIPMDDFDQIFLENPNQILPEDSGQITFPEDSASSRSSTSPPLNPLNSSTDGRTGYQSSSSSSSSEGNLAFRLRQTSGSVPAPRTSQDGGEPMDLD